MQQRVEPTTQAGEPLWLKLAPLMFLLLWSCGYSAVKIALQYSEPLFLLVIRYAVVVAVLAVAFVIVRPPLPRTRAEWGHLAVVGLLVQGLYFGATNFAIGLGASAAGLAIVLAFQPILVALLVPRLAGERVAPLVWLGLALGLAGAAIAILAKSGAGEATTAGLLAAAVGLVFITAGTLYEKRFGAEQHPIVSNIVQSGVALLVALPFAFAFETGAVTWSPGFIGAVAYLAFGNSIVAMTLLLAMLRRGAASRASALFFLVPPTSTLIASALLGETMPPAAWAGMVLAAAGVAITRRA